QRTSETMFSTSRRTSNGSKTGSTSFCRRSRAALRRGAPQPTARLEFTIVELLPGTSKAFEAALGPVQATLQGETLWYRMVGGGAVPRYVRLRPYGSLSAIVDGKNEQTLPEAVNRLIA